MNWGSVTILHQGEKEKAQAVSTMAILRQSPRETSSFGGHSNGRLVLEYYVRCFGGGRLVAVLEM